MFYSREPILITTDDEALEHLTPIIENIASAYSVDSQDDVKQAGWLRVFELLRKRGSCDLKLLIKEAQGASRKESRVINSCGLTPARSKYPRPKRVRNIPEHSYRPYKQPDVFEPTHDLQRQILQTMSDLIAENDEPTQDNVAARLGLSQSHVCKQLELIRKKYRDQNNS